MLSDTMVCMSDPIDDANRILEREGIPVRFQSVGKAPGQGVVAEVVHVEASQSLGAKSVVIYPSDRLARVLQQELPAGAFIFADSISPSLAASLRNQGVMYLDKRGNCFIDAAPLLVDVRGRTQRAAPAARSKTGAQNLFTPRRAQVSGLLLSCPEYLDKPTRSIAVSSGTAVGTTVQTLGLMMDAGYIFKTSRGFQFQPDKLDGLIDTWADTYPQGLGARLELYRGSGDAANLHGVEPLGFISGENAVPSLVHGGWSVDVYLRDSNQLKMLLTQMRLRKDPAGEVAIREAFWQLDGGVVDPELVLTEGGFAGWPPALSMVVYADLRASKDPRLGEVSVQVKKQIVGKICG